MILHFHTPVYPLESSEMLINNNRKSTTKLLWVHPIKKKLTIIGDYGMSN